MLLFCAALGSLRIYDGEYMRAVAVRGHSGPAADVLRRGFRVSDLRLTKPLLDGAPFVHARDLTEFDDPLLPAGLAGQGPRWLYRCARMMHCWG